MNIFLKKCSRINPLFTNQFYIVNSSNFWQYIVMILMVRFKKKNKVENYYSFYPVVYIGSLNDHSPSKMVILLIIKSHDYTSQSHGKNTIQLNNINAYLSSSSSALTYLSLFFFPMHSETPKSSHNIYIYISSGLVSPH